MPVEPRDCPLCRASLLMERRTIAELTETADIEAFSAAIKHLCGRHLDALGQHLGIARFAHA